MREDALRDIDTDKKTDCFQGDLFGDSGPAEYAGTSAVWPEITELETLREISRNAWGAVICACLSGLPLKAEISRFAEKVLAAAKGAGNSKDAGSQLASRAAADRAACDRGDPDVLAVQAAAFKVRREEERLLGLLRFSPCSDGLYLAFCAPDHFTLPLIAAPFALRFGDVPWAIIDEKRRLILSGRSGEKPRLQPLPAAASGFSASSSDKWEDLWRTYHHSVNNESRKNPELQKRFMPVRYWKYLTELKQSFT
jgi:probable DNA metabolism protein